MSNVAERVARAVTEDPALRPIAERYIRVLQEVAVSHEEQAQPSGKSRAPARSNASAKKATLIVRFLKQLKEAQSIEEVHAIQAKYRQAIGRLT